MPELNWRHHTLIQSLLSRGPLESNEFFKIFEAVTGRKPGVNDKMFSEYQFKINKELSFVQFELRACRNQYDGKIYYGVVNNVDDEQSKLGSKYSVPQIAFYKAIIEAIIQDTAGQGCISSIDALHLRLDGQVCLIYWADDSSNYKKCDEIIEDSIGSNICMHFISPADLLGHLRWELEQGRI